MANAVSRLLSWPLIGIVKLYRIAISPWLGVNCRFQPTCAEYTIEALREHGVFKGTWLAARRIGRCHPWGGSGYDPVPGTDKDDAEPDVKKVRKRLNRERAKVLNHAYGFASRGNRDGGLDHIYDCLVKDPDPDTAWPWFLDQMLGWEDTHPALLFAQQYVGRLLEHNDKVGAVKLMLRCRLVNPDFRPLAADLPAAIAAAEGCRNMELVQALRG